MNHFIHPSCDRMVRERIRMYNSQEDEFRWKFVKLHKFMCDLNTWWNEKEYFTYKQENAIDTIYCKFKLHLTNGNGKTVTKSRRNCQTIC